MMMEEGILGKENKRRRMGERLASWRDTSRVARLG